MVRNARNLGPISMAVLLHVVMLASMVAAFDYARPAPITPLMIRATLVIEIPKTVPPPVIKPELIPEQIPDNSEALRLQAEDEKRRHDTLIEKERLEKMRRQKEADRVRKEREEEARKQRLRDEAERKRLEDIERQREENDRLRKELETEQRQTEIDAEERRFAARDSAAMAAYQFAIAQLIRRNWSVPASAGPETRCSVRVTQLPGGDIVGVNILSCNGDDAVKRSVEAAIRRSSPLPEPSDPDLFDRNLRLNLTLERDD